MLMFLNISTKPIQSNWATNSKKFSFSTFSVNWRRKLKKFCISLEYHSQIPVSVYDWISLNLSKCCKDSAEKENIRFRIIICFSKGLPLMSFFDSSICSKTTSPVLINEARMRFDNGRRGVPNGFSIILSGDSLSSFISSKYTVWADSSFEKYLAKSLVVVSLLLTGNRSFVSIPISFVNSSVMPSKSYAWGSSFSSFISFKTMSFKVPKLAESFPASNNSNSNVKLFWFPKRSFVGEWVRACVFISFSTLWKIPCFALFLLFSNSSNCCFKSSRSPLCKLVSSSFESFSLIFSARTESNMSFSSLIASPRLCIVLLDRASFRFKEVLSWLSFFIK